MRGGRPGIAAATRPQEWVIYGWSMATQRVHLIVPKREKADKPLDSCLLTVGGVSPRPSVSSFRSVQSGSQGVTPRQA